MRALTKDEVEVVSGSGLKSALADYGNYQIAATQWQADAAMATLSDYNSTISRMIDEGIYGQVCTNVEVAPFISGVICKDTSGDTWLGASLGLSLLGQT